MKIAFDMQAFQSVNKTGGIGRFNYDFLSALFRSCPENDYILIFNGIGLDRVAQSLPKVKRCRSLFVPYLRGNDLNSWNRWLHRLSYRLVSSDIVHILSPFEDQSFTVIQKAHSPAKTVITIYDFIPFIFKGIYLGSESAQRKYLERAEILKSADLVLSISEATRQDAIGLFNVPPEKIVTIGIAPSDQYYKMDDAQGHVLSEVKEKFNIQSDFVLTVSNLDTRKNLPALLKAFSSLPSCLLSNFALVVVTNSSPDSVANNQEILEYLSQNHKLRIQVLYSISNQDLCALYNACSLFVYASLYEGGGLPVVEAMKCGAPVIASHRSSIPEFVGRTDNLFDPEDVNDMTQMMGRMLTDDAWCQEIRSYGLEFSGTITWNNIIQKVIQAYQRVLTM